MVFIRSSVIDIDAMMASICPEVSEGMIPSQATGVITHSTDVVEHPELVSQRIQRYAQRVGGENVMAGADCGFGGRSHPQIAWAKLESLARGAELASRALGFKN